MTRKDYELVAMSLRITIEAARGMNNGPISDTYGYAAWAAELAAKGLATSFAMDNPRFNKDKFLTACGITETPSFTPPF